MYRSFKEMPIWQDAMRIAEAIFHVSKEFPKNEDYGLTAQLRRSALSVCANIAEAFGRNHTRDKISFYIIARGSLTETQSHLEYAVRVGYLTETKGTELDQRLSSLHHDLNKIIASIGLR